METRILKKFLTDSLVALITPFNKDGSVDSVAFGALLKFQESHGTSAVLIMGFDRRNLDALERSAKHAYLMGNAIRIL
jgi:hypothetical protein